LSTTPHANTARHKSVSKAAHKRGKLPPGLPQVLHATSPTTAVAVPDSKNASNGKRKKALTIGLRKRNTLAIAATAIEAPVRVRAGGPHAYQRGKDSRR